MADTPTLGTSLRGRPAAATGRTRPTTAAEHEAADEAATLTSTATVSCDESPAAAAHEAADAAATLISTATVSCDESPAPSAVGEGKSDTTVHQTADDTLDAALESASAEVPPTDRFVPGVPRRTERSDGPTAHARTGAMPRGSSADAAGAVRRVVVTSGGIGSIGTTPVEGRAVVPSSGLIRSVGGDAEREVIGTNLDFLGPYADRLTIIRPLGRGGMGEVYEVSDGLLKTHVALKVLRSWTPDSSRAFKSEFRVLSEIRHPNLVRLFELFQHGDCCFFTMELVEGANFLSYVRRQELAHSPTLPALDARRSLRFPKAEGRHDPHRLRSCLEQLVHGLTALHAAGKIHRDIKPSNLMIDRDGRLVILDFGLTLDLVSRSREELERESSQIVGTPLYMAPEQAAAKTHELGPATDWYAVGALLYHALTGRPPHLGSFYELLKNKQRFEPPRPGDVARDIPGDLETVCMDLLRITPKARLGGKGILERLGLAAEPQVPAATSLRAVSFSGTSLFLGREQELLNLERAYEGVRAGKPVAYVISGESGVGKTALARRFAENLGTEGDFVVVFNGRCYEKENIPFKAIDGIMDAVSLRLKAMSNDEVSALLPPHADLLVQAFPVLRRVSAMRAKYRGTRAQKGEQVDPHEQRKRLFGAVREFFVRLSRQQQVVLMIDDLQWADPDSKALLDSLLLPPDAPQLMLVATSREEDPKAADFPGDVRRLSLKKLGAADAAELAKRILRKDGIEPSEKMLAAIVRSADGHPLFIAELARYYASRRGDVERGVAPSLDEMLWDRIESIDAAARELLHLVALSGKPLPLSVLMQASRLEPADFVQHLDLLRVANLVRGQGSRETDTVEPYHDRVRESDASRQEQNASRLRHQRLADALEAAEEQDAEALVTHWQQAGYPARAAPYAEIAAQRAAAALAFKQAADFYELALELDSPKDPKKKSELLEHMGDALSSAGRGKEAAHAYVSAIEGAPEEARFDLRRRAMGQLLRAGHLPQGLQTLETVMNEAGLRFLKRPASLIPAFLATRAYLRARGLRFRSRSEDQVSKMSLYRLETYWEAAVSLYMVDTLSGAYYGSKVVTEALKVGLNDLVAKAFAMEAIFLSSGGLPNRKRASALIKKSQQLAQDSGKVDAFTWSRMAEFSLLMLTGDFYKCYEMYDEMDALIQRCQDAFWEKSTLEIWTTWAMVHIGAFRELQQHVPRFWQWAEMRGDLYAATNLKLGLANIYWLLRDDPEMAQRVNDESLERWPRQSDQLQDYYHRLASANILLYRGRSPYELVENAWKALRRAQLLRVQLVKLEALHLRARAALKEGLVPQAVKHAEKIMRARAPWAVPLAQLVLAGAATSEGRQRDAVRFLRLARGEFLKNHQNHYVMIVEWQLGRLIGGREGGALTRKAEAWAAAQGVRNWPALVGMCAPGFAG